MRRPTWAAPTFSSAWQGLAALSAVSTSERHREMTGVVLEGMRHARVIVVAPEQVEALPHMTEAFEGRALYEWAAEWRPPFEPTYFDLGGVVCPGYEDDSARLLGALLTRTDNAHPQHPDELLCIPVMGYSFGVSVAGVVRVADVGMVVRLSIEDAVRDAVAASLPAGTTSAEEAATDAVERVLAVAWFLECANVEMVERVPGETRDAKRAAKRGWHIPLVVQVRQSTRRSSGPAERQRDHSHRFEARAHYRHVQAGAHAKPEHMRPCPIHGMCRREFVSAHVRGPEDKPLIPKLRVVAA